LPSALVEEFAGSGSLVALDIAGWPRAISTDLLWNKKAPPGSRKLAASASAAARIGAIFAIADDLCDWPHFFKQLRKFLITIHLLYAVSLRKGGQR
jgi:hypothetical protein